MRGRGVESVFTHYFYIWIANIALESPEGTSNDSATYEELSV